MPKPTTFHAAFERALAGVAPRAILLDITDSTNDDARALGREGGEHLSVVVADAQRAGRGREGRSWQAERGTSLLASWVARPRMPVERWTVLPLLAGLAIAEAVRARAQVEAVLKWPNDVLVEERKLAGILTEAEPPSFAVVGAGVNVSQTSFAEDLNATSLALCSAVRLDRADLLAAILRGFDDALADVEASMERYRGLCATIGRTVRVERRGTAEVTGAAEAVDARGALIVDGEAIAAGDVIHVR